MRIAVLGAGAMGSWFGGRLALAGHDVHLLTTNELHIAAVKKDGLQMRSGQTVSVVKPQKVGQMSSMPVSSLYWR